jgi:monoamine oxidase
VRSGRASVAGVALVGRAGSLSAVTRWSLAALIRDAIHQPDTSHFYGLRGGWSRLPEALASRLPENVEVDLNARVIDIESTSRGGAVVLQTRSGRRHHPFDHLLCTLPFPTMRSMNLPGFSSAKRDAIQRLRYAAAAKVFFGYPQRWWELGPGGIAGGRSVSDRDGGKATLPRQLYYPSDLVPLDPRAAEEGMTPPAEGAVTTADGVELRGLFQLYAGPGADLSAFTGLLESSPERAGTPGALLAAYVLNEGAEEVRDQPEGTVVLRARAAVARFHGAAAPAPSAYDVWSWDRHEWSRGAFAIPPPGDLTAHSAASRRAEGRAFFAGDHVSIAPGWIQGALESSLRETAALLETVHAD